jgi:outer membrane protein assembly factor BamB
MMATGKSWFPSMWRRAVFTSVSLLTLAAAATSPSFSEDWPQWRGHDRDGVWQEDGILERFPTDGLTYTWRVPVHEGYSGPAVSDGRVHVTDFIRESGIKGTERAICLDEQTGKLLWEHSWPVDYAGTEPRWASGPRATPTVSGDTVFIMGGMGMLIALHTQSGKVLWQHDLVVTHGAEIPTWGVASAPLVVGEQLIALVGGKEGAAVVAFNKMSGKETWRSLAVEGDPGYAPPQLIHAGGVDQVLIWHPETLAGLNPTTGKVLWQLPMETRMGLTVATPVIDDNRILVSSFFDGTTLLSLNPETPGAEILWTRKGKSELPADSQALHALITTPVLDEKHFYGIDSYGELRGLNAENGDRLWGTQALIGQEARWAAGLIVRHADRYFINNDRGELIIARLTPAGYEEIDRTPLIKPTSTGGGRRELGAVHWSHPAYANRSIIVRNDEEIVRASLAVGKP